MDNKMPKSKILSSTILHKGKWLTLKEDKIIKPDGSKATHEVVIRNNGIILILHKKHTFVLTRMYRYPVDSYSIEFPMGFIEKNEEPKDAAIREAKEETGFEVVDVEFLGEIWAWSGLMTQSIFVFAASMGEGGKQNLDVSEKDLEWFMLDKDALNKKIKNNEIKNSATLAAYQLWSAKYGTDSN